MRFVNWVIVKYKKEEIMKDICNCPNCENCECESCGCGE